MIYSLKNPSIFRLTSRPTSPASPPDSPEGARPLARVPFNHRRSSLTPTHSPGPALHIQDKSYLEALGLRLNEAVSKALAHSSGPSLPSELLGGRRPIPAGRGRALGVLIASELQAARDNEHLYRAVLRALHKPLSVLLSDLSALLLPILSSPAFLQPSAPTLEIPAPNATQLHALAIADFAGELLLTFDDMALGLDTDGRGDGLKTVRAGLVSFIGRVVTPLIAGIKEELTPLVDALEIPVEITSHKSKGSAHPSIVALQSLVPVYSRALARYASTHISHALLASFLISIVWRALVALSHRPVVAQSSPQAVLSEKGRHTAPQMISSVSSPTSLFSLKRSFSRPTSPINVSTVALDARALYRIFSHFPRPHSQVAREAVDEAFVHLEALVSLLEAVDDPFFGVNKTVDESTHEIHDFMDELPTLVALPVLLRIPHFGKNMLPPHGCTVAALLNVPEHVYRRDYLSGFGRAEHYGPIVAQIVLDEMYVHPPQDSSEFFVNWLEARIGQSDH